MHHRSLSCALPTFFCSSLRRARVRLCVSSDLALQQEVFFCYARAYEFQKQQQLAMRLYKQLSQNHFVFWGATCMLLQVQGQPLSASHFIPDLLRVIPCERVSPRVSCELRTAGRGLVQTRLESTSAQKALKLKLGERMVSPPAPLLQLNSTPSHPSCKESVQECDEWTP